MRHGRRSLQPDNKLQQVRRSDPCDVARLGKPFVRLRSFLAFRSLDVVEGN